jgi:Tol biopolymer transport system component/predicted Ser/Thr protein kinase
VPPREGLAAELAGAILDGTPVDWPQAEDVGEEERRLLAELKLLGEVAEFHRDLPGGPPPPAPPSEDEGPVLEEWGHLRVLERIGRGSFGDVYRAWDTRLDREVALKLLPAASRAASGRHSIIHEGRLLARVRHPNVVAIYGAEQIGDRVGLWMEFVNGRTLEAALKDGRRFSVAEVVDIGIELSRAVAAVHQAALLHRDIKAQNIALADDGRVVLMDFGTGRDLADHPASDMTGTPLYLAPEILQAQPASVRSDIYSVGVVLYHLLTGTYPVTGKTLEELRANHALPSRAALAEIRPDLPGRVASVVERALSPDPRARFQTIQEMTSALVAARGVPAPNAPARRPWRAAAGATAAAAAVLLAWWVPRGEDEGPPASEHEWIQITRFGDSATAPALSRDGRLLTFIRGSSPFYGAGQVYVKELPDGAPRQLTDDPLAKMSPVFSPDGSQIAYTTVDNNTFRWDTRIISVHDAFPPRVLRNASGLTWIGGRRFLFSEIKKGVHMALVTAEDGAPSSEDLYVPPHARGMVHRSALSPDGQWVLAAEMENNLWLPCRLLPFDGRDTGRPVGPPGAACMAAAWSPDGAWMYLNANAGGTFHVWRQRFPDGEPVQLTAGPTDEHGIALGPDGRSFITSVGLTTSTLWIHDARGARQVSTESNASLPGLAPAAAIPRGTYFSPDRRKLYYLIKQSVGANFLDGELWEADLDSGRTRAILPGFMVASYDVSADGRQVVFSAADANGRPRVWLASLDGAAAPRQLSPADDDGPLFGPTGEIFFRRSENGANFLHRMNADGSSVTRIAGPVLALHSVSPDGRWAVAYAAVEDAAVSVAALAHPTAGGAPIRVCDQCKVSWSQAGKHLYLTFPWNEGRTYVIAVDPAQPFPDLPAEGLRTESDLAALPVVRVIEGLATAPGDDGSIHAAVRVGVQRNLYRVPVR